MSKKDIFIKGVFSGQYTAQKDATLSFSSEDYYNIFIDSGLVTDFVIIKAEAWEQIIPEGLSNQSFLKKIKCKPKTSREGFTGYHLNFDKVKVNNIVLSQVKSTINGDSVGDITCDFYGFIAGEKPKVIKVVPPKVIKSRQSNVTRGYTKKRKDNAPYTGGRINDTSPLLDGCAAAFGSVFSVLAVLYMLFIAFSIGWKVSLAVLIFVLGIYLIKNWEWPKKIASLGIGCLSGIFKIFSVGIILMGLFSILVKQCDSQYEPSYTPPIAVEDDVEETLKSAIYKSEGHIRFVGNDSVLDASKIDTLITQKRIWYNFKREKLHIELSVKKSDVSKAYLARENSKIYAPNLGPVYKEVSKLNDSMLVHVYKALDTLKQEHSFDDKGFLEAIITMVQDIPYRLVLSQDCEKAKLTGATLNFLNTCKSDCCLGNIKFGFQAPTEFIGNLYGDCDTRTVLLYTILKHYHYDVVIINSNQYAHSMLGISSSYYSGAHITHKLKKYYFIETTNIGYYPGTLGVNLNNVKLWNIVTH
ncbi:hypothetical protein [uncultured Algibacter sp.]|uniref:hypothetical protein n=1 Tax=uncultured Algibacter sp. TaxID=298659 RepID=UPI003216E09A